MTTLPDSEWVPLNSSCLTSYKYDQQASTLYLQFRTGRSYLYSGVPESVAEGLALAFSHGRYYCGYIKGKFPCAKM